MNEYVLILIIGICVVLFIGVAAIVCEMIDDLLYIRKVKRYRESLKNKFAENDGSIAEDVDEE